MDSSNVLRTIRTYFQCRIEGVDSSNVLRTIIIYSSVSNRGGGELQLELILQCRIEGLESSN